MKLKWNIFPVLFAVILLILSGCVSVSASSTRIGMAPAEATLYTMPPGDVETRWYTFENPQGLKGAGGQTRFGRKGAPFAWIQPGDAFTLVDVEGSGTVRKIWMALGSRLPEEQRAVVIEMYWDNAPTPAVQAPVGDFFCHALGNMVRFENALFASPEGRSHVSFVPMPFRTHARIRLINETQHPVPVYYDVAMTLGETHPENMLYFHASWRRELATKVREDMTILPRVEGEGRFLGCNLGLVINPQMRNFWWGEGEVKMYVDGDGDFPTLAGTGTEDYVLSAWGQDLYDCMYMGNHYVAPDKSAYGFYRFHIPDPVYFHKNLRVTVQVMGGPSYQAMLDAMAATPGLRFMKAGPGGEYYSEQELRAHPERAEVMEREGDDYCATAYFYLDRPENGLPPLAPPDVRLAGLPVQ